MERELNDIQRRKTYSYLHHNTYSPQSDENNENLEPLFTYDKTFSPNDAIDSNSPVNYQKRYDYRSAADLYTQESANHRTLKTIDDLPTPIVQEQSRIHTIITDRSNLYQDTTFTS
jgi:hypothetical protein